jgi:hypothetical protein
MSAQATTTIDRQTPALFLDAVLSLAQTQLVGQLADETSVDGRTMGALGFSGALFAAAIAAKDVLGIFWWAPSLVLGAAALCCLAPTFGFGLDFRQGADLGPTAAVFYRTYRAEPLPVTREQLLSDLDRALSNNSRRLRAKQRALRAAVTILVLGLPISACLVGLS